MYESIDRMSDYEAQKFIEKATRRLKEAAYARGYKDGITDAKNAEYFKQLVMEGREKNTEIKKVKGYSSAYPNICDLKLLPNTDGTWITIQDDFGTSMTIKLSDISDFMSEDKRSETKQGLDYGDQETMMPAI